MDQCGWVGYIVFFYCKSGLWSWNGEAIWRPPSVVAPQDKGRATGIARHSPLIEGRTNVCLQHAWDWLVCDISIFASIWHHFRRIEPPRSVLYCTVQTCQNISIPLNYEEKSKWRSHGFVILWLVNSLLLNGHRLKLRHNQLKIKP